MLRLVDDDEPAIVDVDRSAPGHLEWDYRTLQAEYPEALDALEALKERNFRSELFVSPAIIESETQLRLESVLRMAPPDQSSAVASIPAPSEESFG